MKLDKAVINYIQGLSFSNGLVLNISEKEDSIQTRLSIIDELVKGKNVIHLGCCDHLPLIKKKQKDGVWLHERITEKAKNCVGIDIDKAGIDYLKLEMGYDNVICADITKDNIDALYGESWDYIIIGEILEHTDNPVLFLSKIKKKYSNIHKFIITVPNAFSYTNFNGVKKGVEIINTDHRYWFTPYTLAKIGYEAGLDIDEFFFVQEVYRKIGLRAKLLIFPFIKRTLNTIKLRRYPGFREGLLAVFNRSINGK